MIFIVTFDKQPKNQQPIKCAFCYYKCYTLENNLHQENRLWPRPILFLKLPVSPFGFLANLNQYIHSNLSDLVL